MFSLAQLLQPISATLACGEDLTFSSELDAIAKARLFDDPALAQGEWVAPRKEADWPFVASRCGQLIESTSKDLRLAVWLAEAQAKTRHLRGLGDAYALLAGLCERYWDQLHPQAEDGVYEQRIGNLCWLLARSPQLVKEVPLTEGGAGLSMLDFEAARLRASQPPAAPGRAGAPSAPAPGLAEMEARRRHNSREFNDALAADAEYCMDALLRLELAVDARLGADGPGFGAAREALSGVLHFIRPRRPPVDPAAAAAEPMRGAHDGGAESRTGAEAGTAEGGAARCAAAAAGPLHSRAQALAQLRQVAEFFRQREPHSPVAYLAEKAANWGEMPLHVWLRAVVKDAAALAQLDDVLGAQAASTSDD